MWPRYVGHYEPSQEEMRARRIRYLQAEEREIKARLKILRKDLRTLQAEQPST